MLYRQGSAAFEAGDHARAVRLLRDAWGLRRTYDVAGTLAQAEIELGMFREAAEHLEFCVRNFPLHESQEQADSIREELERLRARLSRVQLRVVPDGAEVIVNGVSIGKSPLELPIYLEPGRHTLAARLGDRTAERPLVTEAGLEQSVELRVESSGPAEPIVAAAAPPSAEIAREAALRPRPSYVPAIVTASAGAAAAIAGVAFTLVAIDKNTEREALLSRLGGRSPCGRGRPDALADECREIAELATDSRGYRVVSYASFGLALAAGVTAVLLWPSAPSEGSARKPRRPTVSFAPTNFGPEWGVAATLHSNF